MRSLFFLLLLSLLAGCSQASLKTADYEISQGCQNLNDPFYDDAYLSGNVYFSPFRAGESVTVGLGELDTASEVYLIVTDTSQEVSRDLIFWSAASDETLTYTFEQTYAQTEVYWSADGGVPSWTVGCAAQG